MVAVMEKTDKPGRSFGLNFLTKTGKDYRIEGYRHSL